MIDRTPPSPDRAPRWLWYAQLGLACAVGVATAVLLSLGGFGHGGRMP
jgi:hypothetical protein